MVESVTKTLGGGSGIDIRALVTSLVDAQFTPKTEAFAKREEVLKAQISTAAELRSNLANFAAALSGLAKGGTLATQPTSADPSIVRVSALPGARVGALTNSVEVRALATAQVAVSAEARPRDAAIGTGTIRIAFGRVGDDGAFQADGTPVPDIAIGADDATLSGIAARINAAKAGVTAQVVNDGTGERLVLKGASGAARAFTITATDGDVPGLSAAVNVGAGAAGTRIATAAGDARIVVDGVEIARATNSIADVIPGVRLDLAGTGPRAVALGSTPPTAALSQTVADFVATYNDLVAKLAKATDPQTGPLARDAGANEMLRSLRGLTLVDMTGAADGSPRTLAEIGVGTNRDGTLKLDGAVLAATLARAPAAVEAMFADRGIGASGRGLSAALNAVSAMVSSKTTGLGASEARYANAQKTLATDRTDMGVARERVTQRLTQTYASMDARVSLYRSTQDFLKNQVAAWNRSS